jgi:hypothetical protein
MALPLPAFPIDGPVVPEERLIGRSDFLAQLERRALKQAAHQWILAPRRMGKTSIAKALLDRVRHEHVALEVDLSSARVSTANALAAELAVQARAAGVGTRGLRGAAKVVTKAARDRRIEQLAKLVGEEDAATAIRSVQAILGRAEEVTPELEQVLRALAVHALVAEHRVVVLIDEVPRLASIGGAEAVANVARAGQHGLVLLLAGSEESAVAALFDDGPLRGIGQQCPLPDISTADWMEGLRTRFAEIGVEIDPAQLFDVIEASDGHPRRTMLVCSHIQDLVDGTSIADRALVSAAIDVARKSRTWG